MVDERISTLLEFLDRICRDDSQGNGGDENNYAGNPPTVTIVSNYDTTGSTIFSPNILFPGIDTEQEHAEAEKSDSENGHLKHPSPPLLIIP